MAHFDVALICTDGHVANPASKRLPETNARFCDRCGNPTIDCCNRCDEKIRGHFFVPNVVGGRYDRPSYCHACGSPYPWTESALSAAIELADELDSLTTSEVEKLKRSLPDLLKDGPRSGLAQSRFKKTMLKAGSEAYSCMKSILVTVVSETVKRRLFSEP